MEDEIPQFVYLFFNQDGEEVKDRVFAIDANQCKHLEEAFDRLAPKKAVRWTRYQMKPVAHGDIVR